MAVTIQSYTTAGASYTPTQLATSLGTALTDAGLNLYASFTSGSNQVRVFEVTYDGSKAFGKTYYALTFSGADMFASVYSGWNTGSNIPAGPTGVGSQYLDWFSTTLSTAFALRITASTSAGFNNAQSAPVRRYTSAVRPDFSVILMANGSTTVAFVIERTAPTPSMVDLDKEFYTSMMWPKTLRQNFTAQAGFQLFPMRTRRSFLGRSLRGVVDAGNYGYSDTAVSPWQPDSFDYNYLMGFEYGIVGNNSNTGANDSFSRSVILMPVRFANVNTGYSTDFRPPFTGFPLNAYSAATLPADFAIIPVYTSNTIQVNSTIQIVAGSEEYEVIAVSNANVLGEPSIVFGARTVGSP
jgi:hypothetical protein